MHIPDESPFSNINIRFTNICSEFVFFFIFLTISFGRKDFNFHEEQLNYYIKIILSVFYLCNLKIIFIFNYVYVYTCIGVCT